MPLSISYDAAHQIANQVQAISGNVDQQAGRTAETAQSTRDGAAAFRNAISDVQARISAIQDALNGELENARTQGSAAAEAWQGQAASRFQDTLADFQAQTSQLNASLDEFRNVCTQLDEQVQAQFTKFSAALDEYSGDLRRGTVAGLAETANFLHTAANRFEETERSVML